MVIITLLPLVKLFYHVIETVAPEYFRNGEPSLEAGKTARHMIYSVRLLVLVELSNCLQLFQAVDKTCRSIGVYGNGGAVRPID